MISYEIRLKSDMKKNIYWWDRKRKRERTGEINERDNVKFSVSYTCASWSREAMVNREKFIQTHAFFVKYIDRYKQNKL